MQNNILQLLCNYCAIIVQLLCNLQIWTKQTIKEHRKRNQKVSYHKTWKVCLSSFSFAGCSKMAVLFLCSSFAARAPRALRAREARTSFLFSRASHARPFFCGHRLTLPKVENANINVEAWKFWFCWILTFHSIFYAFRIFAYSAFSHFFIFFFAFLHAHKRVKKCFPQF